MQTYKLIENNAVLINQPKLIKEFGRSTAQFIHQLHYWLEKGQGVLKNDIRWIYNTAKEWGEQICLSSRQVERIISKLHKLNIIKVEHFGKTNRVNYITLNYEVLNAHVNASYLDKMSESDRQNVGMNNMNTKITNKDINKSEDFFDFEKKKEENRGGDYQNFEHIHNVKTFKQKEVQTQENPKIIQNMLEIWNQVFPEKKVLLTKQLAQFFYAAYQKKFDQNLDEWRQYLKKIQSSTYLMGKNFNLSLHWVLKFLTIDRILNGELGVTTNILETDQKDFKQKVDEHFRTLQEPEYIRQFRLNLLEKVGAAIYSNVFLKATFERHGNTIVFKSTPFFENYVHQKYGHLLKTLNDQNADKNTLKNLDDQKRSEGKGSDTVFIFENNKDLNLEHDFVN